MNFPPKCFYCEGRGSYEVEYESFDGEKSCTKKCEHCKGKGVNVSQISSTQQSCIFTAAASGKKLPTQEYTMPDEKTRLLCARLILEEAHETIKALGFLVRYEQCGGMYDTKFKVLDVQAFEPDMEQIIDGNCDTIYVSTYCLTLMGIPDVPHMQEVCRANDAKFPNGQMIPHPTVPGKYGKPVGWKPPDHKQYFPKEL